MALTEEQKERIRTNRERALEIKRKRAAEQAAAASASASASASAASDVLSPAAAPTSVEGAIVVSVNCKGEEEKDGGGPLAEEVELEDFEVGASQYVTKAEAMKTYCLPEGTLAVCSYVERDNPRKKGWATMKLYERAEVRRRARERHGGLDGLREERRKRELKRFERDLEDTKDVFKKRKV